MTLEDRISFLENQKNALEQKIRELQNNDNGMRMNAEELRIATKKLELEIRERERAEAAARKAEEELDKISESYRKSSSVISFYKKKAEDVDMRNCITINFGRGVVSKTSLLLPSLMMPASNCWTSH